MHRSTRPETPEQVVDQQSDEHRTAATGELAMGARTRGFRTPENGRLTDHHNELRSPHQRHADSRCVRPAAIRQVRNHDVCAEGLGDAANLALRSPAPARRRPAQARTGTRTPRRAGFVLGRAIATGDEGHPAMRRQAPRGGPGGRRKRRASATTTMSSNRPITETNSGIRSIGLATHAAKMLADLCLPRNPRIPTQAPYGRQTIGDERREIASSAGWQPAGKDDQQCP